MPAYTPRPTPRPVPAPAVAARAYTPYISEDDLFADEFDFDTEDDSWGEDDIDTEEIIVSWEAQRQVRDIRGRGFAVSVAETLPNGYTPYIQVRVPGI